MYTFGRGQYGQLGHGTFLFEVHLPKALQHFCNSKVRHIACGENHTAVVTGKPSLKVIVTLKVAFPIHLFRCPCMFYI